MGMHHQKYDISVSESGAYTPNLSSKNGKTMISHQIWGDHGGPKFQTNPKIRGLNSATVSGVLHGQAQLRLLLRLQTELLVQAGAPPWAQKTHVNGI